MIQKNVGSMDAYVRYVVAALLVVGVAAAWYFLDLTTLVISGIVVGLALAAYLVATAATRFCPIYALARRMTSGGTRRKPA